MPTIRKTTPGRTTIHNHGVVTGGETIDVPDDVASFLVENSGGYEYVDDDGKDDTSDNDTLDNVISRGECPWCPDGDQYEGDHVGQHASSAHPDEWADYAGDDE